VSDAFAAVGGARGALAAAEDARPWRVLGEATERGERGVGGRRGGVDAAAENDGASRVEGEFDGAEVAVGGGEGVVGGEVLRLDPEGELVGVASRGSGGGDEPDGGAGVGDGGDVVRVDGLEASHGFGGYAERAVEGE